MSSLLSVLKYFWWKHLHRPVRVWCHFMAGDSYQTLAAPRTVTSHKVWRRKCLVTNADYCLVVGPRGERKVCFSTGYVNAVDEQGYPTRHFAIGYEPLTYRAAEIFPVDYTMPWKMSTPALNVIMDETFMRHLMEQSAACTPYPKRFWRRFFDSEELPESSYTPYGLLYKKCLRKGVVNSSLTFEEFIELIGLVKHEINDMQTV